MSKNTVTLTNNRDGKSYEFDILDATVGPSVINISTLYKETGMFTYDEGYTSTASCKSDITYIDGAAGKLMYRGYDISYLSKEKTFLDTAFLLLNGELPSEDELGAFSFEMQKRSFVHEGVKKLFDAFPDRAHPMAILSAGVSALSKIGRASCRERVLRLV